MHSKKAALKRLPDSGCQTDLGKRSNDLAIICLGKRLQRDVAPTIGDCMQPIPSLGDSSSEHACAPTLASRVSSRPALGSRSDASLP